VDLPDPVDHAGVEQDPLGEGRLARVDVRRNPNIPRPIQRIRAFGILGLPGHDGKAPRFYNKA
jgi:hypothetical protein